MVANKFKGKTVSIVGIGGVGSILANRLLRLDCSLRIVDRDRIFEDELARQNLYTKPLVNKFKVKEAKKALDGINPNGTVKAFHEDLVDDNTFLLKGIIIDASNDLKTNKIIMKKAQDDKFKVVQVNYAGSEAIIKYYEGKTKETVFKKNIKKAGVSPEIPELAAGAVIHVLNLLFSNKKPKPEIKIDCSKTIF